MTLTTATLALILWPFLGGKAIAAAALCWPIYEIVLRLLYRNEVPCPYCGFDASWYKRDIGTTKKIVERFWKEQPLGSSPENHPPQPPA